MDKFDGNVLVVSNECFNWGSSNGRTLMNLLSGIPSEQLAQFYIHGIPDQHFCKNYFRVSDMDALHAVIPVKLSTSASGKNNTKAIVRNCRNLLLRNIIWQTCLWWTKEFDTFLNRVSPSVVILQAGDAPFMYDISIRITKRFHAPLVIYNSEAYVLKKTLYDGIAPNDFWHNCLQVALKRAFRRGMRQTSCCVYNTEYIAGKYHQAYPMTKESIVIYTASSLFPIEEVTTESRFTVLYCGNLGVGRIEPLCEVADVLYELDSDARLQVYGTIPSQQAERMLCSKHNVEYGGRVSYEEVIRLIGEASMLLHCENSAMLHDLEYAFSTKIADNLASGRPFLVYASEDYPFVKYLKENACAHVASSKKSLREMLGKCMKDRDYRMKYADAAVATAARNHNLTNNCTRFQNMLERLCKQDREKGGGTP